MILLDTHVFAWLYADPALLPPSLLARLDHEGACVSPASLLEAERWKELGRLTAGSREMLETLAEGIGLLVEGRLLAEAFLEARAWPAAGDAIDRVIVAQASLLALPLATKNPRMLGAYSRAFWD